VIGVVVSAYCEVTFDPCRRTFMRCWCTTSPHCHCWPSPGPTTWWGWAPLSPFSTTPSTIG